MMTRIQQKWEELKRQGRKALVAYITLGDPDLEMTGEIILSLEHAGADIVELGVPFSDPLADGPVIQRAAERSLQNGFTLKKALGFIADLRKKTDLPFLLFSYYNPLYAYGFEKLTTDAKNAGVDGFLITDLSVEEAGDISVMVRRKELNLVFLAAPTSTEARIKKIAAYSTGFIYAVSRTGVTGEQTAVSGAVSPLLGRIREHSALPVAVGFGISTPAQVRQVQQVADGAVVGSALVRWIEENRQRPDLPLQVEQFTRWLKGDS
jgi:tryptophan synthase alpha chain